MALQDLDTSRNMAAVKEMLKVLAILRMQGVETADITASGEDYLTKAISKIGEVLLYLSETNASCTLSGNACTIENMLTGLELTAEAQLIGVSQITDITANMEVVNDDVMQVEIHGSDDIANLFSSIYLLEKMASQGDASRLLVANGLSALLENVDLSDSSMRGALERLREKLSAIIGLYPVSSGPDPLEGVRQKINQKLAAWASSTVAAQSFDSFPTDDLSAMFDQLDMIAVQNKGAIEASLEEETLISISKIADQGPQDRFAAAAELLRPVVRNAGADLNLAYSLTANVPPPEITDETRFKLALISSSAEFIVNRGSNQTVDYTTNKSGDRNFYIQPAAEVFGIDLDPVKLLIWILGRLQPQPGFSPGMSLATGLRNLLTNLSAPDNTITSAGLAVAGSAVDGALTIAYPTAQSQPVDWMSVLDNSASVLANQTDPRLFWLSVSAKTAKIGIDTYRQTENNASPQMIATAAATAGLAVFDAAINHNDFNALLNSLSGDTKQQVMMVAGIAKNLSADTLSYMSSDNYGDSIEFAFARSVADAVFGQSTQEPFPLGKELSYWGIDFARSNKTAIESGNLPGVMQGMVSATGVPELTCIMNRHINGISVPPAVSLVPFVAAKELVVNAGMLSNSSEAPKILFDVGAGMVNLLFSPAVGLSCASPSGIPADDVELASLVRSLKNITEFRSGFDIVGRVGLAAIGALDSTSQKSFSRALNVLWYVSEQVPSMNTHGKGLGSALDNDINAIEFALNLPGIAGKMIDILSGDPDTSKVMNLLAGDCQPSYMLGPDKCKSVPGKNSGAITNLVLAMLGDVRRKLLMPELGTNDSLHYSDNQWGYMKTVHVLSRDTNK